MTDSPYPALIPGRDFAPSNREQPPIDETARRLYDDARPSIVKISTENGTGSGFFIDDKGTIATDAHVVDKSREHFAITSTGRKLRLELKKVDDLNDLAILAPVNPYPSKPLPMATRNDLTPGDPVYALGHPLGQKRMFISPGTYTGTGNMLDCFRLKSGSSYETLVTNDTNKDRAYVHQRPLMAMDIRTEQGNSGGPVIDRYGKAVAMTDIGWKTTDFNTPISRLHALNATQSKFDFKYEDRPSQPIYMYQSLWRDKPMQAIAASAALGAGGYGAYHLLSNPSFSSLPVAAGGMLFARDAYMFTQATDRKSRMKYGLGAAADLGIVAGGLALMYADDATLGLTTVGISAAGRLATEFIPNRRVLVEAKRNDDRTDAFPFMRHKYVTQ